MRAIIIDPFARKVEEIQIPNGELDTIYEAIGADCFCSISLGSGVKGFLDDQGLKRKGQAFWYFKRDGIGLVLNAGKALIVSMDHEGEITDLDGGASVEQLEACIHWVGDGIAAEIEISAGLVPRPSITVTFEGSSNRSWEWSPVEQRL